ncbi:hypothetical protein [Deinococcus irradiatisoli]|uniref:hypothetical protein n=1 Tax=Deinococcus irradiatisoli TaxID=2202254 RepID=UPI0011B28550|nr:hypothetical protein [Deinococcus irradiatisoli]
MGVLVNIYLIEQIYHFYGNLYNIMHYGGSTFYTQNIQEKSNQITNIAAKVNYIIPNFIIPLLMRFKKRFLILILIFVIFQGIFAVLYGARILVTTTLLTILIASTYNTKLNFKVGVVIFATLFSLSSVIILGQSLRSGGDLSRGLSEIEKYYSVSLINGSHVIEKNLSTQELFWTLRPILSIPFLPRALGIIDLYENKFGKLQISNREQDFSYASSLGIDPRYNTFSSFGYAYLDIGWAGMLLLFLGWLVIQCIYLKAKNGTFFFMIIFPAFYTSIIDQLRTYWFFSERNMYAVFSGISLYILMELVKLMKRNIDLDKRGAR